MSRFFRLGLLIAGYVLFFAEPSRATSYYTYTSAATNGFWNVAGTWTTDPSGVSLTGSAVPGNNDVVTILNGFTVVLNANVVTTGHTITINNGGVLDLSTFTIATIGTLTGSGTLRLGSVNYPAITTNNFVNNSAAGATVEYYNFSGNLPISVNYPNLKFTNSTSVNHVINFQNPSANSVTVFGTFTTQVSGTGLLSVNLGTQASNIITMAINGNIEIGANTTWGVGAPFNAVHAITVSGDLINNGTVDLSNDTQYAAQANGAATIKFTGATNNLLACNGRTDLYTLTLDKGSSSTYILSVTSTSAANLNFFASTQLIILNNGTLQLGTNINIPRLYGSGSANYDVGSSSLTPMLWVDGATVNANSSALVIYGKFRITAGSFTTTGGEGSVIREEGQYIIEGGTFITEKFRPSTTAADHRGSFTMTGGTFNAQGTGSSNNYARFSLPYPDQVFIMSGGTINVSNPQSGGTAANGGIHIGCKAANYNVTGGTINAILSGTATSYIILSTAPFYNLNISKTGGTPTTVQLNGLNTGVTGIETNAQPLVVLNDFNITTGNTPVFNANGKDVTVGGNFIVNTATTYTPSANTTFFNGTGNQQFSNSGTITSGLYNLTVDKASGTLTLAGSANPFVVSRTLTLNSGVLNDGGKTIQALGNIINKATHSGTGNITLLGTSTQTLSGDGNGIYGNLILSNTSSPGASVTANLEVSGKLTLAGTGNSLFDINQYTLSLTSTAADALTTTGNGFSSAKMVRTLGFQSDGGIKKTFGSLTAFVYGFGVGTSYTPATIQLTATPAIYGTISVKPVATRDPFVAAGNTNNLDWYWRTTSSGFTGITTVSHAYQYVETSVAPAADDANYVPARYTPTTWTIINDLTKVDEAADIISFTNVSYVDGDFTAGVPAAFGIVKVFYSKRNGDWFNTGAGTTPWSNVSHTGPDATTIPTAGDHVYIGDGGSNNHVVTTSTDNAVSGGMEISTGSTMDVGTKTGHNFGALEDSPVTGGGTLRISSATATAEFPAGDFGNFIRASGGTVVYYSTGTQDFTIPLSSASPTGLPLITYRNLIVSPSTGRYIEMPNQDLRIFNDLTVTGASATGIVRLNSAAARTLTVNGNISVTAGGLQYQNGTAQIIDLNGSINISSGASFSIAPTGTAVANALLIDGGIVNNGNFDLSNSTRVCDVTFRSTTNTSVTGTGPTTDFNILTVSKGLNATAILDVNATAFSLSGAVLPLVLQNGTFRLTSAQIITFANGADFTIPSTARLSANGGTLQLTGGDGIDLLLSGTLEILGGTINVGTTASDNSIEYAATGQPTITVSGGSLNVRAQVRRSTASNQGSLVYNQSGSSAVTLGISSALSPSRGILEVLSTGSSFTMSGGTLSFSRKLNLGTIAECYIQPGSGNVTGGTIQTAAAATSQTISLNTTIPLFNVASVGTNNILRLEANPLTLRGSLSIAADCKFFANSLNVGIAGNLTNSNVESTAGVNSGGYQPGNVAQITFFNGSMASQSLTGTGTNLTNFGNLVINNTFSGGSVTLQPNTNLLVNGNLTMTSGTVAGVANTMTVLGTVSNSTTQTNTTGSIVLEGTSSQLITGNGSGKFGNLTLNNLAGAVFGANQEITGTLTLTLGMLSINSYALNLSSTSLTAISGATATKHIVTSGNLSDGGVTKAFAANITSGNFIYPVGVSGKYTPANYTLTTGGLGGTITIRPVNSKHPNATGPGTAFIKYYWSVTSNVIIVNALTHTYTYDVTDESGTVVNYRDARFKGGAWTIGITAGNPNTTARVITFTNTDVQSDYTAGEATAFVNPTTYTSVASGNWEADLAVWDIDPPGTGIGPPQGSFVIISEGHTVTMNGDGKRMATLEIRGRLNLGTTNSHDFGTVTTTGTGERTMQLQSSIFPTGDFSAFNAAGGGTVEYDGNVGLSSSQATYNNLRFTSAGTKTLANVDLTINGNFTVSAGTVNNAVNNRTIYLPGNTGDFTNNGVFSAGTGPIIIGRDLINSGSSAVFNGPNGTSGLRIGRNFVNSTNASFLAGTDSIGIRGNLTNSAVLMAGSGAIRVTTNLVNAGGTFTAAGGIIQVKGSITNNATFSAGTGAISVTGSFGNSGASATYNANANALTIGAGVTLSAGSVFNANTGSVTLGGNWNNTSTFNSGTGSVTFGSASDQNVTGTTSFYNLSRTGVGTLTLNNNVTVSNLLSLTNSNVITGSNTLSLTNTTTQPVTGYGTNAYIDGILSVSFPSTASTSRVYPIGKGAKYRPVTIQQTAASTTPVVKVEMIETLPTGTYPTTVGILSEARYYKVDLLSGTMNAPTIDLSFNTNGTADENVVTPSNARVLRSTASSGPWTNEGGTGVFAPADPAGHVTSDPTSIANPTYFTLGYTNQPQPITLQFFNAELVSDYVQLTWSTYTEINNRYFTIERSDESLHFDSISSIDGAGNSNTLLKYSHIDQSPLGGVSYYRLRQTDYDAKFTYSKVVRIVNDNSYGGPLSVYPNPAEYQTPVKIRLANATKDAFVLVCDILGRVLFSGNVDLSEPVDIRMINLRSELGPGTYVVRVSWGSSTQMRKLIVY